MTDPMYPLCPVSRTLNSSSNCLRGSRECRSFRSARHSRLEMSGLCRPQPISEAAGGHSHVRV